MSHGERRGSVTLCAVLLLFIVSTLGMAELTLATTILRLANRRFYAQKAQNLAFAGADEARAGFIASASFMSVGQTDTYTVSGSDGGTVTLTCTSNNGYTQVTSVGTVTGPFGNLSARVRVGVYHPIPLPPLEYGISSINSTTLNGGSQVLSSPTPGQAGVYTNGNLTLAGTNTKLDGNAYAVGTITNSGAILTGTSNPGSPPLTFPDIDQSFKNQSLVNGTTTGSITLSGGASQIMKGKYSGDVTLSGAGCTILTGSVVWVTGSLTLHGSIRGTGTVVVDGQISASGNTTFDSTMNVLFISTYPRTASNPTATAPTQDAITLNGGSLVYGFFYAPYARLTLAGGADVFGGVAGLALSISGGSIITVPDDGRAKPPTPLAGEPGWEEF